MNKFMKNRQLHTTGATLAALIGFAGGLQAQAILYDIDEGQANDRLGGSADSAGDVNNDGVLDFVVGAPENGNIFGGAFGYAKVYSGFDGSTLLTVTGTQATAFFGHAVAGVGDVNNDNHDDIAVGTPYFDGQGLSRGGVTVFSGLNGSVIHNIQGLVDGERLGERVAGLGDVNNDGVPDFAACAFNSDVIALNSGTLRVYSGASGQVLYNFEGTLENAHFGEGIADVGDYNNDGFDDIAGGGDRGPVRIYSGQNGSILKEFPEPIANSQWGFSIRSLGDLTGDGIHELIVGAPQSSVIFGGGPGYVRVINGATGAVLREIVGDMTGDSMGYSVDSAGDYDGDGTLDYLVGAPVLSSNTRPGYARVYSGANGAILESFPAASNTSSNGAIVRLLGDLNSDGGKELCVGQPDDSGDSVNEGSLQVYSGSGSVCSPPTNYCFAVPNTSGSYGKISYSGSNSYAANNLVLSASDCPPGQLGMFFYGTNRVFVPFGSGIRCVGGGIYRMPPVTSINGSGVATAALNLNGLPNPNGQISVGETWNFQFWFRDPGDGDSNTNLTEALEVRFCE